MLIHKGKVWIPSDPLLRKLIMESEHDSLLAGHMGIDKTMELVDRNFYWLEMAKDIEDYVRCCEDCQKNKAFQHKTHGALYPLELSYTPWDAISCKGAGPRGQRLNIHRAYVLGKERRLLIGNVGFLNTKVV